MFLPLYQTLCMGEHNMLEQLQCVHMQQANIASYHSGFD